MENMKKYLRTCKFSQYYKELTQKLSNKTVIIYGTGSMFRYIKKKYRLTQLNIIGVCDCKYEASQEGETDLGYQIIPRNKLEEYEPDYLLIGAQNYISLIYDLAGETFKNKKTKVLPLVKIPTRTLLEEIWSK